MKILVFNGYGPNNVTPKMKEIMDKNEGIKSRTGEIIHFIEEHAVKCSEEDYVKMQKQMKKDPEMIVCYRSTEKVASYQIASSEVPYFCNFAIIDVDTSRPWTIDTYDGAENIKYLDERTLVDEELNYYEEER